MSGADWASGRRPATPPPRSLASRPCPPCSLSGDINYSQEEYNELYSYFGLLKRCHHEGLGVSLFRRLGRVSGTRAALSERRSLSSSAFWAGQGCRLSRAAQGESPVQRVFREGRGRNGSGALGSPVPAVSFPARGSHDVRCEGDCQRQVPPADPGPAGIWAVERSTWTRPQHGGSEEPAGRRASRAQGPDAPRGGEVRAFSCCGCDIYVVQGHGVSPLWVSPMLGRPSVPESASASLRR